MQRIVRPPWAYFLSPLKIGPGVMINGAVLHGQFAHHYYEELFMGPIVFLPSSVSGNDRATKKKNKPNPLFHGQCVNLGRDLKRVNLTA